MPLPDVEPYRHGEFERIARHVRRWRRERLSTPHRRDRLLIESGKTRAFHNPTGGDVSLPIDGEGQLHDPRLMAGLGLGGIALMAFKLEDDLSVP